MKKYNFYADNNETSNSNLSILDKEFDCFEDVIKFAQGLLKAWNKIPGTKYVIITDEDNVELERVHADKRLNSETVAEIITSLLLIDPSYDI